MTEVVCLTKKGGYVYEMDEVGTQNKRVKHTYS